MAWNDEQHIEAWKSALRAYKLVDADPVVALLAEIRCDDHIWLVFGLHDGNVVSVVFVPGTGSMHVDRPASRCAYPEALRVIAQGMALMYGGNCPSCLKVMVPNVLSPVMDGKQMVECPLCYHQWGQTGSAKEA